MKKNTLEKITIGCFTGFIAFFSIANAIAPKKEISWNENRELAKAPSLSSIPSGNFDDQFETWFSDHFVFRDQWIALKAGAKKAALAIENNNVYFAEDHRLIQSFQSYSERTLKQNITLANDFCNAEGIRGNILLVPDALWGAESDLPDGAWNINEEALLKSIAQEFKDQNFIDLTEKSGPSPSFYYHTDHHWNEQGAYMGYAAICEKVLNKSPEKFTYEKTADHFQGTMYSRSGAFWNKGDSVYQIIPKHKIKAETDMDDGTHLDGVYSPKRLEEKDKYQYYLDGNHAYYDIRTDAGTGRKAVIVQDSYSHILMPYLITEYDEIQLVDLRYYHDSVSKLVTDKDHTDLYFIYSLSNFAQDPNLVFLK